MLEKSVNENWFFNKIKLFIITFPIFLLLIPTNVREVVFCFLAYLAFLLFLPKRNFDFSINRKFNIKSFILASSLGIGFFFTWYDNDYFVAVSGKVGIPGVALALFTVCVISLLAYFSVSVIIKTYFIKTENAQIVENNGVCQGRIIGFDVLFCAVVAFFVGFQFTLNPLSNSLPLTDSSVFIYMGKMMHNGYVPYRDLFDHKGIIIYFIEYVGTFFNFGGNIAIGVWIIELINMFAFTLAVLKLSKMISRKPMVWYSVTFLVPAVCGFKLFEGANLPEEYALPFIAWSLVVFLRYLDDRKISFAKIAFCGASFAVCLFLKVTTIPMWIAFVIAILIILIIKKEYFGILKCIAAFIVGIAVIAVPISLYLIKNKAFADMIDCYLLFNFSYSGETVSIAGRIVAVFAILSKAKLMWLSLAGCIICKKKNEIMWIIFASAFVSALFVGISGEKYGHYGIILLPIIAILLALALDSIIKPKDDNKDNAEKQRRAISSVCLILSVAFAIIVNPLSLSKTFNNNEIIKYLKENYTTNDDVLVLGNACPYYLSGGIQTKCKYFFQTPPINISDKIYDEFSSYIENEKPDCYVLLSDDIDNWLLTAPVNNTYKVYKYVNDCYKNGEYSRKQIADSFIYEKVK